MVIMLTLKMTTCFGEAHTELLLFQFTLSKVIGKIAHSRLCRFHHRIEPELHWTFVPRRFWTTELHASLIAVSLWCCRTAVLLQWRVFGGAAVSSRSALIIFPLADSYHHIDHCVSHIYSKWWLPTAHSLCERWFPPLFLPFSSHPSFIIFFSLLSLHLIPRFLSFLHAISFLSVVSSSSHPSYTSFSFSFILSLSVSFSSHLLSVLSSSYFYFSSLLFHAISFLYLYLLIYFLVCLFHSILSHFVSSIILHAVSFISISSLYFRFLSFVSLLLHSFFFHLYVFYLMSLFHLVFIFSFLFYCFSSFLFHFKPVCSFVVSILPYSVSPLFSS